MKSNLRNRLINIWGKFFIGCVIGILLGLLIWIFVVKIINDVAFATGFLALATIVLAFFTYRSVRSSNEREKRDREERMLSQIVEWAIEIRNSSLTFQLPIGLDARYISASKNLNMGIPCTRGLYLRQLVDKFFNKSEMANDIDKIINSHFALMIVSGKRIRMTDDDFKVIFGVRGDLILSEVNAKLENTEKLDDIEIGYAQNKALASNALLDKVIDILSKL